MQRIVREGHHLGSCSDDDDEVDLASQYLHTVWTNVIRNERALTASGSCVRPRTLRPAQGSLDHRRLQLLGRMGYAVVGWNFETNDTVALSADVSGGYQPSDDLPDFSWSVRRSFPRSVITHGRRAFKSRSRRYTHDYVADIVSAVQDSQYLLSTLEQCLYGGACCRLSDPVGVKRGWCTPHLPHLFLCLCA